MESAVNLNGAIISLRDRKSQLYQFIAVANYITQMIMSESELFLTQRSYILHYNDNVISDGVVMVKLNQLNAVKIIIINHFIWALYAIFQMFRII